VTDKVIVSLGTATPGGGFPLYGGAVAEVVNAVDPTLDVQPRNTKGSTENVPLLEADTIDIGLVQGEVALNAKLPIIAAMYSSPGMFVVRADSPYRTIEDLKGKPVAFGAQGSGLVILAKFVLDGLGLDRDKDFQAIFLERAGDGPAMVLDGRAAALWGAGIGWPGFTTMAKSPGGARFIVPDKAGSAKILARHTFLRPLEIAAGAYPGIAAPMQSIGSWSFIMARPTLPDDVAYRLARALHKGEAQLGRKLDQARETTAANTAGAARAEQLHPGVARYLKEIGALR
jgi:TRAP transporter TAXI family solute receptor